MQGMTDLWKQWLAQNLMLGVSHEDIASAMTQQGFDQGVIREALAEAAEHPYVQGGRVLGQQVNKLNSLVLILDQLERENSKGAPVERRVTLEADEFFEAYYALNRPVVIESGIDSWPALKKWAPEFFKAQYGHVEVEIQADREANPSYQREFKRFCKTMTMAEYVDQVLAKPESNDIYLAAKNTVLGLPRMQGLFEDIGPLPPFLAGEAGPENTFLWFGPANTVTPLHHDWQNAMVIQIFGRKQFKLVSAKQSPLVYNTEGRFSDVNCDAPDYERFPLFKEAQVYEVELAPGEMIFIPVGWWHHVRALEISISLTMTQFRANNVYLWQVPQDSYLK